MYMMEAKIERTKVTFSQARADLLMKCSEKQDMTECNEWRKQNPKEPVLLQNSNIENADL